MVLDIHFCWDLYFLAMVEWEKEDLKAHPDSAAEKQFPIFFYYLINEMVI